MASSTFIEQALIRSITNDPRVTYVTIQYGIIDRNQITQKHLLTLVVGRTTRITDQFGSRSGVRSLSEGMVISARFTPIASRINQPLARADRIMIIQEDESSLIVTERVLETDQDRQFGYLLTGIGGDIMSQTRYVVSDETKLRDRHGNRIRFREIRPGQTVRIERASFQTMSIPPQTSALTVQVLSR